MVTELGPYLGDPAVIAYRNRCAHALGNEDKKNKQSFKDVLSREMDKEVRPGNEAGIGIPNAYRLELSTRPTQSLFYREMVDLSELEGKVNIP